MNHSIESLLLGKPYLELLPNGAKRAYTLVKTPPIIIQSVNEIAVHLQKQILKSSWVAITTGFPVNNTFETDGPIGTFILGNLLAELGINVIISTESPLLTVLEQFPWSSRARIKIHFTPISELRHLPPILISVERPGKNYYGICHNMRGESISDQVDDLEYLIEAEPPEFWLGIGDGGNELGLGMLNSKVEHLIPFGKKCVCGCGGGIAVEKSANDFLVGITSNLAALTCACELAKLNHERISYSWINEVQLLEILNDNEIIDGVSFGKGTVDSIPKHLSKKIIESILSYYQEC
ncbi:MAG: DUF4392 domain-containing protein [Candidatus Lokiarchaeota archaeon]|nr:DUF4392 domain-containing protein [Candidatus Harpocratesius repetitus]